MFCFFDPACHLQPVLHAAERCRAFSERRPLLRLLSVFSLHYIYGGLAALLSDSRNYFAFSIRFSKIQQGPWPISFFSNCLILEKPCAAFFGSITAPPFSRRCPGQKDGRHRKCGAAQFFLIHLLGFLELFFKKRKIGFLHL